MAKEEIFSLNRWFRNKYNLSPKDPAFLDLEQWEIELEYQTDELERELSKTGSFCLKCGGRVVDNVCINCGKIGHVVEKYSDPNFNEYFEKVEKQNEEFFKNLKWEEVPDTKINA